MCPSIPPPCKRAYNFIYSPLSSKDLWQFWKKSEHLYLYNPGMFPQKKRERFWAQKQSEQIYLYNPGMFPKKKREHLWAQKKWTCICVQSWNVSPENAGTFLSTEKKKVNIYTCTILEWFPKESKNASKHRKTWTSIPVQSWNVSPEKAGTFLSREVFGVPHCWLAL